jgi:hypothetical protein
VSGSTDFAENGPPVLVTPAWKVRATQMEKIMSKGNDSSLEDRALADSELDAVTGGASDCFFEYTERTLGGPDTRTAFPAKVTIPDIKL